MGGVIEDQWRLLKSKGRCEGGGREVEATKSQAPAMRELSHHPISVAILLLAATTCDEVAFRTSLQHTNDQG